MLRLLRHREKTFTKNQTQGTSKLKGGLCRPSILPRRDPASKLKQTTSYELIAPYFVIANRTTPDGREKTLKAGFLSSMSPGFDFL
jgi:hypothetical protein